MTPLHMAVEKGHAEIISLLTGAGAKLEARTDEDVSAWLVVGECIVLHLFITLSTNASTPLAHMVVVTGYDSC